jgi:CheY-like chemotaxis protein
MTADQVARAFEPFFTTKPPGAGTGLGLPTVYGIVTRSDGVVGIYSEPGHGTTVRVHIPAADAPVRPEPPAAPAKTVPGTGERVLLVEDEDAVRTLAARVLRRHGYEVLEAAEGEAALALEETAGRLDLLLTDLVMPGMSGKELADALRERQADVPVLFTSGYTDDALMRHGIRQEHVAFLGKPFTAADLLAKVRETLDRG